jgi:hypothetical protein
MDVSEIMLCHNLGFTDFGTRNAEGASIDLHESYVRRLVRLYVRSQTDVSRPCKISHIVYIKLKLFQVND